MLAIVDVFGQAVQSGSAFFCDAARAAAHELGVFDVLARGPMTRDEIADALGVAGRHRLGALLDVLAAIGAIRSETGRFAVGEVAERPVVARAGWGLLGEVIRENRPLALEADGVRRFHHHLAEAGAAAARELAGWLGTASLLDLGAGAGAYSKAFLLAQPGGTATLVDTDEVLELAKQWLGPLASRAQFVEGDASELELGGHQTVLLANVLHLHGPIMCARLCAAAARAVAPGGTVIVKDLRVDDDRSGPLEGLLFALNMALYTELGTVHSTSQLRAWLQEAGLVDIEERRLVAAPDAIIILARRPVRASTRRREAMGVYGER